MPLKKNGAISSQKTPNTTLQTLCQENDYPKIRARKAPNTTLQKLCQEIKIAQIRAKRKST